MGKIECIEEEELKYQKIEEFNYINNKVLKTPELIFGNLIISL